MFKKFSVFFLAAFFILSSLTVVNISPVENNDIRKDPPFGKYRNKWSDSVFLKMNLDEKIGQLFMIAAYPKFGINHWKKVGDLIEKYHIGGIIVMQGTPSQTVRMINYLQSRSKIPLMVAIDAEWGLSMRLDSTIRFPYQLMLGAVSDNELIYEMGNEIARQMHRLGIHINFAPVVDINNNPLNPIIGIRSFGEDKFLVSAKGIAYMNGLQDKNVLAVAKHFPGHGDTDKDSHKTLPVINVSAQRLDTLELVPFGNLIYNGVGGVMTAHLYIKSLVKKDNLPATLAPQIIDSLLIKKLQFNGLIFTDALIMKGVSDYFSDGEAELKAIMAGNDILLMPNDLENGFRKIKQAVLNKKIKLSDIDKKVLKILNAKYWFGLNKYKPASVSNLYKELNNNDAIVLKRKIVEQAITLVKNEKNIIPFKNLDKIKIASVSVADGEKTVFQDYLLRYADVENFEINKNASAEEFDRLAEKLKNYDYVIIGIHKPRLFAVKTHGITGNTIKFVSELSKKTNVVLDIFNSPYALQRFQNTDNIPVIVVSYDDDDIIQELSAQLLFGGIKAIGKLPVTVAGFKANTGLRTEQIRLKYSIPAELKINEEKLHEIDTLLQGYIEQRVFPGCQVLAAKNGIVFYQKSFGFYTYEKIFPVEWYNLYDIASVTKITATVPALMKLYEEKKFDPEKTLGYYLPQLKGTNKYNLSIKAVLAHQARLRPWIPFYWKTVDWRTNSLKPQYYSYRKHGIFTVQVADEVFLREDFEKSIYESIYNSPLRRYTRYKYSDLGFYMFKQIIEMQTNTTLDKYIREFLYSPLGAWSVQYNPLHRFPREMIVPTELDTKFRHQLLQGYVHDYGAALLGGVGGHAGLFANANDLAKYMQMLINGGTYGGIRFFKPQTIKYFTSKPFYGNRRALGFDSTDGRGKGPACRYASAESFGHTGFTGCMIWADPKYDFVYIFLSNRIYPSMENNKINSLDVRGKIQRLFYEAFLYSDYAN